MNTRPVAIFTAAILMVCGAYVRCGAQTTDARSAAASTSVPRLVQFNGTLKDTAARPVSGVASVTFAIYAEQDGGSALWTETQNVLADPNGHFNALLGTSTTGGFPSELFSTGQSRWLGVTIARQPEMPRVMLASVPYAMKAGDADTLGGLPASSLCHRAATRRPRLPCSSVRHDHLVAVRNVAPLPPQQRHRMTYATSRRQLRPAGHHHRHRHSKLPPAMDLRLQPRRLQNLPSQRRLRRHQHQHAAPPARRQRQLHLPRLLPNGAPRHRHRERRPALPLLPVARLRLQQLVTRRRQRSLRLSHRTRPKQRAGANYEARPFLRPRRRHAYRHRPLDRPHRCSHLCAGPDFNSALCHRKTIQPSEHIWRNGRHHLRRPAIHLQRRRFFERIRRRWRGNFRHGTGEKCGASAPQPSAQNTSGHPKHCDGQHSLRRIQPEVTTLPWAGGASSRACRARRKIRRSAWNPWRNTTTGSGNTAIGVHAGAIQFHGFKSTRSLGTARPVGGQSLRTPRPLARS